MKANLIFSSGKMFTLERSRDRRDFDLGGLCSAEIVGFSQGGGVARAFEFFFREGDAKASYVVWANNFPLGHSDPLFRERLHVAKTSSAYLTVSDAEGLRALLGRLSSYVYGEFCLFRSRLSVEEIRSRFGAIEDSNVLSILFGNAFDASWVIAFDAESDTGTVASVSRIDVLSLVAENFL